MIPASHGLFLVGIVAGFLIWFFSSFPLYLAFAGRKGPAYGWTSKMQRIYVRGVSACNLVAVVGIGILAFFYAPLLMIPSSVLLGAFISGSGMSCYYAYCNRYAFFPA